MPYSKKVYQAKLDGVTTVIEELADTINSLGFESGQNGMTDRAIILGLRLDHQIQDISNRAMEIMAYIKLTLDEQKLVEDWNYEVANGDTKLGYDEWKLHQIESNRG